MGKNKGDILQMTTEEYLQGCYENAGYCEDCDEITTWGVEPDADGYVCDECGEKHVMGLELALLRWLIDIGE